MHKIATKVLVNKLKTILDDIISINQSAFIPSRLTTNNVLALFDLNKFLKEKLGFRRLFCSKLDMKKTYDRVE